MNDNQKHEIKALALKEKERLGTNKAVGNKCRVSESAISQLINERWSTFSDEFWIKVGGALGYNSNGWQLVETYNSKLLQTIFADAKSSQLWIAVSHRAGSGKTSISRQYAAHNTAQAVYYLQCREWRKKNFLAEVCGVLGIRTSITAKTGDDLIKEISTYFHQRASQKPLLILDEVDKLTAEALRSLIPLYNELEDRLGVVALGTDNLERDIITGVTYKKKGYDEIYSRFGRSFVRLHGASKSDVAKMAKANNLKDSATINRIFQECNPVTINIDGSFIKVVEDLRKVKRAIKRELIMQ